MIVRAAAAQHWQHTLGLARELGAPGVPIIAYRLLLLLVCFPCHAEAEAQVFARAWQQEGQQEEQQQQQECGPR